MNVLQHCTLKCFAAVGEKNEGDLECFFPLSYFHISFSHSAFEQCFMVLLISLCTL